MYFLTHLEMSSANERIVYDVVIIRQPGRFHPQFPSQNIPCGVNRRKPMEAYAYVAVHGDTSLHAALDCHPWAILFDGRSGTIGSSARNAAVRGHFALRVNTHKQKHESTFNNRFDANIKLKNGEEQ